MSAAAALQRSYPQSISCGGRSLQLRRLGSGDRAALRKLVASLSEQDLLFLRIDITDDRVMDQWIAAQDGEDWITILALDGKRIAGYGTLHRDAMSWTRHLGEIRVIVGPDHRGTGLGARLTREIFELARELGVSKVVARMPLRQEGARRMFEKLGFHAEALLADWVIDRDDRTQDLVIMSYDVTGLND
ncbi:MAG TPA: GNAT family N-acetyltransferase [Thermoanaerobaculia bacterium]|nr:GNAT family N-acetyltransferase [Thermoanaerobaculia bacterium]